MPEFINILVRVRMRVEEESGTEHARWSASRHESLCGGRKAVGPSAASYAAHLDESVRSGMFIGTDEACMHHAPRYWK